jgi:mRNA-degrading endonuclease RelE of RelBE toxin-antitoxin system
MSYSVFFASSFARTLKSLEKKYPHVRDDVRLAVQVLVNTPQIGTVIPGGNGIRKLRILNSDAARGKSGGYRLLYIVRPDRTLICLLLIYSKSELTDITRRELSDLLDSLSTDLGEKSIREELTTYQIESVSDPRDELTP